MEPSFVDVLKCGRLKMWVMEKWRVGKGVRRRRVVREVCFVIGTVTSLIAAAQSGNTGIEQANTLVRGYFNDGVDLLYAIGAILGLIGAVRVYQKWSHGDHDTGKTAAAWFGSCIFLVVVATLLHSFFGV